MNHLPADDRNHRKPNDAQAPTPTRRRKRRPAGAPAALPSARDGVYVLFKHKTKAACVAAGVLAVALAAAAALPSKYTSEAQLLIRMGRESMPNATVAGGPQAMPMVDRTTEVNSEAQILRSIEVVQATVDRLGVADFINEPASTDPAEFAEQKARAVRALTRLIDVKTEPMSAIVKVTYDAASPEKARDVVQAYVEQYLDHRSRIYSGHATGDLFAGLTRESQGKLLAIEEQMRQIKDQTGVSDVDAQKTVLLNRIASLQSSLDSANAQLASTINRIKTLEEQRDSTPRQITLSQTRNEPMGVVSNAETELNKLRADLDQKLATYVESSPTVTRLQDQIARAEQRLQELGSSRVPEVVGLNPTWAELDKQLVTERTNQDGLDAQIQSTVRELAAARRGQALINDVELRMGQLARDRGMLVEQLRKLVEGRDFSSIDEAMGKDRVGSVTPSQNATLPTKPSSPNRPLLVLFGLFASLAAGAGAAVIAELLSPNVGRPIDLKRLGFGRVYSLPTFKKPGSGADAIARAAARMQSLRELADRDDAAPAADRFGRNAPRPASRARPAPSPYAKVIRPATGSVAEPGDNGVFALATPAAGQASATAPATAGGVAVVASATPNVKRPAMLNELITDACHAILERFIFAPVATGEIESPRSIAVLSIEPGHGATTIASHLAASFAHYADPTGVNGPRHVLIVDANEPRLNGGNRVIDLVGDCYADNSDATTRPTAIANLDALVATEAPNGGRRYGRWADAVTDALTDRDRIVVVDLPCMAGNEATARVAGACDAAILVVEADEANREVVRQAGQRLAESGVRLLGVVLNRRAYPIPETLYRWM